MIKLTIPGRLVGLNEYTDACRRKAIVGAKMKREQQDTVLWCIKQQIRGAKVGRAVFRFHWVEKDRRRDPDNICFAKKFVLDALQEAGVIVNDNWDGVAGLVDTFSVGDKPRIEIEIESVN